MTPDWATGMLLASAAQGLAVILALCLVRAPRATTVRLAGALAVLAGMTTPYLFGWRGHHEAPDWLAFLPVNLPLAFGPLLYVYTLSRVGQRERIAEWPHFAPAVAEFSYLLTCTLLPAPFRHIWKEGGHDHLAKPLIEAAVLVSLASYSMLSVRLLIATRRRIARERSDADEHSVPLLWLVAVGLLLSTIGLTAIRIYAWFIGEIDVGPYFLWLATIAMAASLDAWRAATHAPFPEPLLDTATTPNLPKRNWSALGEGWQRQIATAGWWREPDLDIASVARRIGVSTGYLSRGLNDGIGKNFNELVNGMRAAEVARMIDLGVTDALLTLAMDAGFSSKATFNRSFSATLGMTPSAYRRRLKLPKNAEVRI